MNLNLDFISADMAIGVALACGVWMLGTYIYNKTKSGSSLTSAVASVPGAVAGEASTVEGKLKAVAQGTASAINTVRQEASVKLSAVEAAMHERLVALETSVFGSNYSPATQAAAAPAAPVATPAATASQPATLTPVKAPVSHVAAAHSMAKQASTAAATAVAGLALKAGQ